MELKKVDIEDIQKILKQNWRILVAFLSGVSMVEIRRQIRKILNQASDKTYEREIENKLSKNLKIIPEYQYIKSKLKDLEIKVKESDIDFIKARDIIKYGYYDQVLGDSDSLINNLRIILNSFLNNSEIKNIIFDCKYEDKIFEKEKDFDYNTKNKYPNYLVKDKTIIQKIISDNNMKYLQKLDKICKELERNKIENKIIDYLKSSRQKMDVITDPEIKEFDVCYKGTCEIKNLIPIFCMIIIYNDIMEEFLNYIGHSLSYDELKCLTEKLIVIQALRNKYEHRTCANISDSMHKENVEKARDLTFGILNIFAKFPLEQTNQPQIM